MEAGRNRASWPKWRCATRASAWSRTRSPRTTARPWACCATSRARRASASSPSTRSCGIVEIARPVGVVAAITPSTNPGATPANKIINALKGRNAVIVAPSPKGPRPAPRWSASSMPSWRSSARRADLVQMLPAPVTKDSDQELMRQADLVVATGSQANVRAAYTCGTPAFGVGAGNVASIIDASADLEDAAAAIMRSKTFDNATSCSSENSVVILDAVYADAIAALQAAGGVLLDADEKAQLQAVMWPDGKLAVRSPRRKRRASPKWPGCHARAASCTLPDGRGNRRRAGLSLSPARSCRRCWRVSGARLRPRLRHRRRHLCLPGRRPFGQHPQRRRCAHPAPRPRTAGVARDREPGALLSPPAAASTTACPSRCRWAAAPGAATTSPTT
jgi:hypothetical protein